MVFSDIGKKKLIFCSRIAETSLTINGVKLVIDIGEDLESVYIPEKRLTVRKLRSIT